MKEFRGRVVANGTTTAKALVSHGGLNTLASFQKALQFGDKKARLCVCRQPSDQRREDWFFTVHAP